MNIVNSIIKNQTISKKNIEINFQYTVTVGKYLNILEIRLC